VRANENKGKGQLGLGAGSHGVVGRGVWHCSGVEAVELLSRVQRVMHNNDMIPRSTNVVFKRIGFAIQKGLAAQLAVRLPSITMGFQSCYIKGRLITAAGSFSTYLQKVAAAKRGLGLIIVYDKLTRPTFGMTVKFSFKNEYFLKAYSVMYRDQQQYDKKNIRRRVYDALNVLIAMDIISKDQKEIQWQGLPNANLNNVHELKREHLALRSRIDKKASYLKELQDQVDVLIEEILGQSSFAAASNMLIIVISDLKFRNITFPTQNTSRYNDAYGLIDNEALRDFPISTLYNRSFLVDMWSCNAIIVKETLQTG
nr:transcription factor-like protein DPB isoform X1 [Tanacetum cinerariifolium]